MLTKAEIGEPPIDAVTIAQRLGLTIAWDDRQTGRARTVKLAGTGGAESPSILLRHDQRLERQHWAVAHEIGESLAQSAFKDLGIDAREAPRAARELVANGIASRLLLPRDTFAADGAACNWDLLALKERYNTASHELIARRMLDFPPLAIIAVFDQNGQIWRKTNLPGRLPKPSPIEIECRQRAHESGKAVFNSGPPIVNAWPIHEPPWQREIVRVEIDEFAD
jgi:Zn-dependent peptidase ImmA (M78 family)